MTSSSKRSYSVLSFSPPTGLLLALGTLRDLDGKVLREYLSDSRGWSAANDYLYRDGLLLAAETQTGRRHFHLDHLGTPRLITRASGDKVSYHVYYPFGEEATVFNQDSERMKFTGHERDLASAAGAGDDLDYMHARFCSPLTGRFLSTDIAQGKPGQPQSWNRYAYTRNNPLKFADSNGRETASVFMCPGTLSCGGPLPIQQELALWGGIVGAGALAAGGAAVATGSVGVTAGASTLGEALTLIGARFQSVINFFRNLGAGLTDSPTPSSGRAALLDRVVLNDGSLKVSGTVAKQLAGAAAGKDRSFIPVQAVLETIASGSRAADPQGAKGVFLYVAEAASKNSKGFLEVAVDEVTGTIVHILYKSK